MRRSEEDIVLAHFGVEIFKLAAPTLLLASLGVVIDGVVAVGEVAFARVVAAEGVNSNHHTVNMPMHHGNLGVAHVVAIPFGFAATGSPRCHR
jgi:hypothetical protein